MTEKEFIAHWIKKIRADKKKFFPEDYLGTTQTTELSVPPKVLLLGEHLFGNYEITTVDGEVVHLALSYEEAKYIVYASRNKTDKILIPVSGNELKKILAEYDKEIDSTSKQISLDFKNKFPESKNLQQVTSDILKILNLVRF